MIKSLFRLSLCMVTGFIQIHVELTKNNVSDAQLLEDLLAQILLAKQINSIYTVGTKCCRQVILDRDACAIILSRKNVMP